MTRSKPTVHPCPLRCGGCGLLTGTPTHNNESKKTQHDNNMVAEQVLRDLSVRRASAVRSLGAQISVCPWSVQTWSVKRMRRECLKEASSPTGCSESCTHHREPRKWSRFFRRLDRGLPMKGVKPERRKDGGWTCVDGV